MRSHLLPGASPPLTLPSWHMLAGAHRQHIPARVLGCGRCRRGRRAAQSVGMRWRVAARGARRLRTRVRCRPGTSRRARVHPPLNLPVPSAGATGLCSPSSDQRKQHAPPHMRTLPTLGRRYVGALCAQSLRLDEAAKCADRALAIGGVAGAQAAARVRLAVCRGAALCGSWERVLAEAQRARALIERGSAAAAPASGAAPAEDVSDGHALFRQHQRAEVPPLSCPWPLPPGPTQTRL